MTGLQKLWDFTLGIAVIAGTPIVSILVLVYLASKVPRDFGAAAFLMAFGMSFVAYLCACSWRRKHRRLSQHVFPWEVLTGTVAGLAFMAVYIFASATAALAD
jgi:phosphoglycerol transferase MdoB-like AlkP superfamily enzyme